MKRTGTLLIAIALAWTAYSQQETQYTMFMFNKLVINPGYTGSAGRPCITAFGRGQWIGVDGAPQTQLLSFHMPLANDRIGIGASVQRNAIGPQSDYTGELYYAYRIPLGTGYLGLGLQGSVRHMRVDFSKTEATQPNGQDGAIPLGVQTRLVPNFGAGLYYQTERFYAGFSVPRLLESNIELSDNEGSISREVRHYYFLVGATFPLGESVVMEPQVFLRYVKGAPFDADFNLNFWFIDQIMGGLSYRLGGTKGQGAGESISILAGAQIGEHVFFGLSYDIGLSDIRDQHSGSVEGVLRFCIGKKTEGEEALNPRFY
jgi:type IX secretion system PorP/SprF family membrane protein